MASCSTLCVERWPSRTAGSSRSMYMVRLANRNAAPLQAIGGITPQAAIIGPESAGPMKRATL
jgi:hypothetical protein